MALVLKDRVKETTTTTGTGTLTLLGAATGYQSFTAIGDGNTCYYAIATTGSAQWEVGIGTYTASGTTLSRDTILDSSTGGGAIDLAAGTKEVFVTYPSEKAVFENASGDVVQNQFTSMNVTGTATINVGTFTTITGAGSGITSINASNISSGTLANDRTTAATANGASTIVARDASGNFTANVITANGSALTALNATAITTGALDNARTSAASANGASTIVARDGSGNFSANVITANGSALTALNATAITTGTLDNARTTASDANGASTIVARDASGNFTANVITANGSALTALNATAITTGTLSNDRTTAASANGASTIIVRDASGNFTANTGTFTTVTGAGSGLTSLNASNISSGTVPTARLGSGTADATTFLRGDQTYAVVSSGTLIPSGTVMIFGQTSAPTGFTKLTDQDDAALRVVSGSASTGGSVGFTTAFASKAVTGTVSTSVNNATATNQNTTATGSVGVSLSAGGSVSSTTLATSQIPAHQHVFRLEAQGVNNTTGNFNRGNNNLLFSPLTNNEGGGGSHTHSFTNPTYSGSFTGTTHTHTQDAHNHTASSSFTGTAINLAVKYVDVIRATKD